MSASRIILPNRAKTPQGEWVGFRGQLMIEPIKRDGTDQSDTYHGTKYRISIKIPEMVGRGVNLYEIVLKADNDSWGKFHNPLDGKDVPDALRKMVAQIKDLQRQNKRLQKRNRSLERHFSRTAWDEEQERFRRDPMKVQCDSCMEDIDREKAIEGKDYCMDSEGEYLHIECAVERFSVQCQKCHLLWADDDHEDGCPECGGKLLGLPESEIRKHLTYDAVKHYLPKELHDKVKLVVAQK